MRKIMTSDNYPVRARPMKGMNIRIPPDMERAKLRTNIWTMRHIMDAADILVDDLAEIARRVNHPEGRAGYRARELVSEIGIHGFPKETIRIVLPSKSDGGKLHVLHFIDNLEKMKVSLAYDKNIVLRFRNTVDLLSLPTSMANGLKGCPVGKLIDFTGTSIPQMNEAKIKSIYAGNNENTIYVEGEWVEYDLEVLAQEMKAQIARNKDQKM